MLAPDRRERVHLPRGRLSPALLVDGRIAGVWAYQRNTARLDVNLEPFARISNDVRTATTAEAERLASFLGCGVDLSLYSS